MNAKQFLTLVEKGNSLDKEDFKELLKLHENFPFFQVPKVLAAKYELEKSKGNSKELLHWAAIQSPNRKRLKFLVENQIPFLPPPFEPDPLTTKTIIIKESKDSEENTDSTEHYTIRKREEVLKKLEENLNRFTQTTNPPKNTGDPQKKEVPPAANNMEEQGEQEKKKGGGEDLIASIKRKEKKEIVDSKKKEQNDIIKAFNEKNIKLAAIKEQEPAELPDLSIQSTVLNDKMFSESYAKLLVKQKKITEAKEIYQKLMLKFPEKKAYFADLINGLNE